MFFCSLALAAEVPVAEVAELRAAVAAAAPGDHILLSAATWISAADVPAAASADGMCSGASPEPSRRIVGAKPAHRRRSGTPVSSGPWRRAAAEL